MQDVNRGYAMRKLVLWGHHIQDYREMFDLSEQDMNGHLLEYGCCASAVNAELHEKQIEMVSCDPMFILDKATLFTKVSLIFEEMVTHLREERDQFDFSHCGGIDAFIESRRQGMAQFFSDYPNGLAQKRYLPVTSHTLPFEHFSFDLALSSHYLFADLEEQDAAFHIDAIRELARVAKEVRIFPLIDRFGQTSSLLGPVLLGLQQEGFGAEVREVTYSLQPKGNAMLRVWALQCNVNV